jgi:hypothetical protein
MSNPGALSDMLLSVGGCAGGGWADADVTVADAARHAAISKVFCIETIVLPTCSNQAVYA